MDVQYPQYGWSHIKAPDVHYGRPNEGQIIVINEELRIYGGHHRTMSGYGEYDRVLGYHAIKLNKVHKKQKWRFHSLPDLPELFVVLGNGTIVDWTKIDHPKEDSFNIRTRAMLLEANKLW